MTASPTLSVTGATGQLGGLVVDALLARVPAAAIVAGARDPDGAGAATLRDKGVAVRAADYSRPETLAAAFAGIDRLLLVSGSENGRRREQHRNVIDSRIVNTLDPHRLIGWASERGDGDGERWDGAAVERRLLALHVTEGQDVSDRETLADAASSVGLDRGSARAMLASDAYREQVRAEEARWRARGITGVPAIVVDDRYLIAGGQPPAEYERQLRAVAAAQGDHAHG